MGLLPCDMAGAPCDMESLCALLATVMQQGVERLPMPHVEAGGGVEGRHRPGYGAKWDLACTSWTV